MKLVKVPESASTPAPRPKATRPGVALQLYTVRSLTRADFAGTLRAVAGVGYTAVEFAGYGGLTAPALGELLEELNLTPVGTHVGLGRLLDACEVEAETARRFGCDEVVCPALPAEYRQDEAGFHRAAQALNQVGRRCQARGARFSYHIHGHEFLACGAHSGMDILVQETDDVVHWEPDTYWIARAGHNPAAWIGEHAARCRLVHLKDVHPTAADRDTEVGAGTLDLRAVVSAATAAEWLIVEQEDFERPPLESAAIGLRNLLALGTGHSRRSAVKAPPGRTARGRVAREEQR